MLAYKQVGQPVNVSDAVAVPYAKTNVAYSLDTVKAIQQFPEKAFRNDQIGIVQREFRYAHCLTMTC
jgi:hypothetical protein